VPVQRLGRMLQTNLSPDDKMRRAVGVEGEIQYLTRIETQHCREPGSADPRGANPLRFERRTDMQATLAGWALIQSSLRSRYRSKVTAGELRFAACPSFRLRPTPNCLNFVDSRLIPACFISRVLRTEMARKTKSPTSVHPSAQTAEVLQESEYGHPNHTASAP
jgi:hypothetical protein